MSGRRFGFQGASAWACSVAGMVGRAEIGGGERPALIQIAGSLQHDRQKSTCFAIALLAHHGLALPDALPGLERAAVDDLVDAAAAAWTAQRVALVHAMEVRDSSQPNSVLYA